MSDIARKAAADLKPSGTALSAEVREWQSELRVIWEAVGLSMNQFACLYGPIDKGTISRYLNGQRVPRDRWFLDKLLAIQADKGRPATPAVREHLTELHLRALQVAHPHEYRVRLVNDQLEIAITGKQEAERYARALEEQLAERNRQVTELAEAKGRLRAAWDADRVAMQADYERLTREIGEITGQLHLAQERTVQAERRCQLLEDLLDHLDSYTSADDEDNADTRFPQNGTNSRELGIVATRETAARREDCYAVGIELRPYQFTAVLSNGSGEAIDQVVHHLDDMEPGTVASALTAATREIVPHRFGPGSLMDHVALGVQLGGPVDTNSGTVHYLCKYAYHTHPGPPFKWNNVPLGPRLQQETGFQTIILNDAAAFAEREQWHGVGQETGDFVVMLLNEGVSGAIVSNDQLFKGPVEIGQFVISSVDSFRQSDAGVFGALESVAGTTAIAAMVGEQTGHTINDLETAIRVVNEENGPARAGAAAFLSAGVAIAQGLSYLIQFAGPSHAVLYAPERLIRPGSHAADAFLSQVTKFRNTVAFEAYRKCSLVVRPIGVNDGAHGVALAALRRCFQLQPMASSIAEQDMAAANWTYWARASGRKGRKSRAI